MCFAGMHALCEHEPCCCSGNADLETLLIDQEVEAQSVRKEIRESYGLGSSSGADGIPSAGGQLELEERRGDSGYIHPDAWPSSKNIGELADPLSTGRKRQAEMYPIQKGQACEWAGKLVVLQGMPSVVGCIHSPATDLHHGPDKNTLNNESASRGVGVLDNTWAICSECHNSVHAKHNGRYEEYDRVADQARPWLPVGVTLGMTYELQEAPLELLFEEEQRRAEDRKKRNRQKRGRQARTIEEGRFDVRDEED
jgi:hypothetical protein